MIRVPSYIPSTSCGLGFLAEAPGDTEVSMQRVAAAKGRNAQPLIGKAGWRHEGVLRQVGVDRTECYHGNVFSFQLPYYAGKNNNLRGILVSKAEWAAAVSAWRSDQIPPVPTRWHEMLFNVTRVQIAGGYLPPAHWPELVRCWEELAVVQPAVLVLYGGTALWATCAKTEVKINRGHLMPTLLPGIQAVCTYHPANTFHQQSNLQLVEADVRKAWEVVSGARSTAVDEPMVWVPETPAELEMLFARYVDGRPRAAWDIETYGVPPERRYEEDETTPVFPQMGDRSTYHVTSIQVCADGENAVVVPFDWWGAPGGQYWSRPDDHAAVVELIQTRLADPAVTKIFQNGLYDIEMLWELARIEVHGPLDDTMLLMHANDPGTAKGLTDGAARHLHVTSWKHKWVRPKRGEAER